MKRRRGMEMVMVVAMIAGCAASVQATLLSEDTLDRMHDSSLWYQKIGVLPKFESYGNGDIFFEGADLNDDEWPQRTIQRNGSTDDFIIEYRAESSKWIPAVEISAATNGGVHPELIGLSWASGNDVFTSLDPTSVVDRGWAGGGWKDFMMYYDLTGLGADRVRVIMKGPNWWQPFISSAKLDVVPEPATSVLAGLGGLLLMRRRR